MALTAAALTSACESIVPEPRPAVTGHVSVPAPAVARSGAIPSPVTRLPAPPRPVPAPAAEIYTVVVNGVPVRELLFALARDAAINVDIHPDLQGAVTLNAIDQSLPQILERLSRQVNLRYEFDGNLLVITRDQPFLRTYTIDYVNLARETIGSVSVSTQIATTSGGASVAAASGDNNSSTAIESTASHAVWERLVAAVNAMIVSNQAAPGGSAVLANPEAGLLSVRANAREHREIQAYLDRVAASLKRQVLIEATVVEVTLRDNFQAGINWSKVAQKAGVTLTQSIIGGTVANAPFFLLQYTDATANSSHSTTDLTVTARLLKEFGDVRVLSSPRIMTLNNQTAVLKVVDNRVYFTAEVSTQTDANGNVVTNIETTPQTVPVGFVMTVTPQITSTDAVTLNVRPTISRILQFVNDPNPNLTVGINRVPEIQVREFESVLQTQSGQIAVLGGLMQDSRNKDTDGIPLLSELNELGDLFKFRNNAFTKSELVIFVRPWVIRKPSVLAGDLGSYKRNLPENLGTVAPQLSPQGKRLQGVQP
ncbi:MAG: pilus (MSHA type) biogenesis protein MshL [Gammaproteobacteria bacterium]|nr:pilus (MSHA type) biogenesis protein MshL [Gammaproteobacteria bacterium]